MDLGEDWSNNEIIQAVAIGEFTNLDGIEWRNGAETTAEEFLMRLPVRKVPLQTKYREPDLVWLLLRIWLRQWEVPLMWTVNSDKWI